MSGIEIEKTLLYFAKENRDLKKYSSDEPLVVKLDSKIKEEFLRDPDNSDSVDTESIWTDTILELTYPKLKKYWEQAFVSLKAEVDAALAINPNKVVFINLHSCYFHNKTQEYISLVKLDLLASLKLDMIITFIDDIYEIYHRLCQLGGIFNQNDTPNTTDFILRHIRLLDWRSKETLLSRFYAENMENCRHYLFAVKHSSETLYNLIFENRQTVYLSHPITEVRRLQKDAKVKEAAAIIKEINDISNELTLKFTAFLPTTIDEFRIDFSNSEIDKLNEKSGKPFKVVHTDYYSVLTPRWDYEKYKDDRNLIYRSSGFEDINTFWKTERSETIDSQTNHLLAALDQFIQEQVTVRDYTLTEQSDLLVLYRPLFNGNPSKGVFKELDYFKRMKRDSKEACHFFVYCPQEDIDKFYVRQYVKRLEHEMKSNKIQFDVEFKNFEKEILFDEDLKRKLLNAKNSVASLLPIFDVAKNKFKFHILDSNSRQTPLGDDNYKEYRKSFTKGFFDSCEEIITHYTNGCCYFERNKNVSITDFIKEIENHLTPKK